MKIAPMSKLVDLFALQLQLAFGGWNRNLATWWHARSANLAKGSSPIAVDGARAFRRNSGTSNTNRGNFVTKWIAKCDCNESGSCSKSSGARSRLGGRPCHRIKCKQPISHDNTGEGWKS